MGSLLYAVELPPYGGDTLFANQYLAYERLSEGLRRTLADLTRLHLPPSRRWRPRARIGCASAACRRRC